MIRIDVFSDYGLVNTWWDECVNLKLINDNSVELNDDFLVMKNDENFIICSCGHNIFEFNKNDKDFVSLRTDAPFESEKQFDSIYDGFITELKSKYQDVREMVRIKEMVDKPNKIAVISNLLKKYGSEHTE